MTKRDIIQGEVIFQYLYDLGGDIDLEKVETIYGKMPSEHVIETTKTTPKYISLKSAMLTCTLNPLKANVFGEELEIKKSLRVYAVGATAIEYRVPFSGTIDELILFSMPFQIQIGKKTTHLREDSEETKKTAKKHLASAIGEQYEEEKEPEEYTVFCITKKVDSLNDKRTIAALIRGEKDPTKLSKEEVADTTKTSLSYTHEDKIYVDWDGAVVIEPSGKYEDVLMTIELALLQLLELRSYDHLLDKKIDETYTETKKIISGRMYLMGSELTKMTFDLARIRIEVTELVEKTMNITKFMGDWYLAKLYDTLAKKLHIKDWHSSVIRKLDAMEELYSMASDRSDTRQMNLLEILIIVLIVLEISLAALGIM